MFAINPEMTTAKAIISAAASAAATAMLLRTISQEYVPNELRDYIYIKLRNLFTCFSSELTLIIEEYDSLNSNHLFQAAEIYLEPIIPPNTKRLKISLPKKESNASFSLERDQEIIDTFDGVTLKWRFFSRKTEVKYINDPVDRYNSVPITEDRLFELSFHKKHKKLVTESYIKHVIDKSKEIKDKKKTLKLFTLGMNRMSGSRDVWQPVNLEHPAKFDTLAMDMEVKKMIMEDLDRFVRRKEFYKRVGKAWKRGYLLFGPPGTGKSSLIAAMANYLNFDIYDLELTDLRANSDLRNILISTGNKSILVVEDIDCSLDLQMDRMSEARAFNSGHGHGTYRDNQVTLSGLLNFVDGLWSSCGDERIIIFTTNHKEKLDPALLRPGRMDVHVHMSYCTPYGFKMLASNYLGIKEHPLFVEIEELIEITNVSPAEIAEQLMKSEEPGVSLRGLIEFIECKGIEEEERKKRESEESRVKAEESKVAKAEESEVAEAQGGEQKIMSNGV